jgi:hypothetical protein
MCTFCRYGSYAREQKGCSSCLSKNLVLSSADGIKMDALSKRLGPEALY